MSEQKRTTNTKEIPEMDKGDISIYCKKDGLFNLISSAWITELPLG